MSQHRVRERRAGSGGFSKRVEEIVQYDVYRIYFFFFLLPFLYRFFLFVCFYFCFLLFYGQSIISKQCVLSGLWL